MKPLSEYLDKRVVVEGMVERFDVFTQQGSVPKHTCLLQDCVWIDEDGKERDHGTHLVAARMAPLKAMNVPKFARVKFSARVREYKDKYGYEKKYGFAYPADIEIVSLPGPALPIPEPVVERKPVMVIPDDSEQEQNTEGKVNTRIEVVRQAVEAGIEDIADICEYAAKKGVDLKPATASVYRAMLRRPKKAGGKLAVVRAALRKGLYEIDELAEFLDSYGIPYQRKELHSGRYKAISSLDVIDDDLPEPPAKALDVSAVNVPAPPVVAPIPPAPSRSRTAA